MSDDKQRVIFEQNCQDFRSLNETLWKVPIIVITLTGGLWFGVGSLGVSDEAKKYLLYFSGVANIIFALVLIRLRFVMDTILKDIKSYQGKNHKCGFIFVTLFSILLALSAILSGYAAYCGPIFYTNRTAETNDKTGNKEPIRSIGSKGITEKTGR